jgi:hypothetical protein
MWQCGDVSTSRRRLQGALVARSCYPLVAGLWHVNNHHDRLTPRLERADRISQSMSTSQSVTASSKRNAETGVKYRPTTDCPRVPFYTLPPPPTSLLTRAPSLLQTGIQPRCTLATQLWPFLMRFATSLSLPARHNQAFRESCTPQNPKPALSHHKAPHPH